VAPFLISSRVRLRISNAVRRAQPRSGMPGREAPIPPSPPEIENGALVAPFLISSRVQLRMRVLFDRSPAANWPCSAAGASESHSMANNFKLESTAEIRRFRELPKVWRVIQSETILRASRT